MTARTSTNDNASGMAGTIEAARVLTQQVYGAGEAGFDKTVVFAGLAGEEQGLFGGQHLARKAADEGWEIEAVLNNDMIGNIAGIDRVIDNFLFGVASVDREGHESVVHFPTPGR